MGSASAPEQDLVWGKGRARVRLTIASLACCHAPAFHQWLAPCGALRASFHAVASGYRVRFPAVAEFELSRDGLYVTGSGDDSQSVTHLFWNHVFPLAASLQGLAVLHGGAVEIEGRAVAFLGASGLGKSTLTAALAGKGFRFFTDDALALVVDEAASPIAVPGHGSIRLWPDSADQLAAREPRKSAVALTEKTRVAAGGGFLHCDEERHLHCIYLLGDGSAPAPAIGPVAPANAVFELAKSSFLIDPCDRDLLARQFRLLSRVAAQVPVFGLDYPRVYDALRSTCDVIADHASRLARTP